MVRVVLRCQQTNATALALAHQSGNYQHASNGKTGVLVSAGGALLIGGANAIVAFFSGLGAGVYQATLVLFLAVPTSKPDRVEDRLDAALETVLGVLEDYGSLTWDEVERSTLAEKFHGYRITTTAAYSSSEQE